MINMPAVPEFKLARRSRGVCMSKIFITIFGSVLVFGITSVSNAACTQSENQFMGTVVNVRKIVNAIGEISCTYQIQIRSGSESGVCPLRGADAQNLVLLDPKCERKDGDSTSGVLVTKSWIE